MLPVIENFDGVIIVGAGPAGIAAAASIETRVAKTGRNPEKLRYRIIEKSNCIASLWEYYTYDKLTLQRPKNMCQLHTDKPFPDDCPEYPPREDFLEYLRDMAKNLKVEPQFNEEVVHAEFDSESRLYTLKSIRKENNQPVSKEYKCRGIIVASGIDGVPLMPDFKGLNKHFPPADPAKQIHSRDYKNGEIYKEKSVLVVGYGDSGIDICGDLHKYGATPYIVVRRGHKRTDELFKKYPDWPLKDINLSELSKLVGNFGKCKNGIIDPEEKIRITAYSDIKEFERGCVVFKDNEASPLEIDCVIMATGYTSNVRKWCKDTICFHDNGNRDFHATMGMMVKGGACAVGFSNRGLCGIHKDAKIASEFEYE